MNCEVRGSGPAVLLLHGLGNDLRMWAPLAKALEGRFTLISCDLRGSGRSAPLSGLYSIEEMAADAAGLADSFAAPPAGVLGFSMGGCVAIALALARPELASKLVLVSSLPSWRGPCPPSQEVKELFHRTDVSDELLTAVYETIFGPEYRERVSAEEFIAARMGDELLQTEASYLAQLAALESFDARSRVGSITADTLVVTGSEDRVVPPENSRWLAERIPRARLETIAGAGHMLPLERPADLAALCAPFISR